MPTDPNLPADPTEIPPPPPPKPRTLIQCEYCECSLTPAGDCFRMSERAKAINKQEQRIEELRDQLTQAQAALSTAQNELTEARQQIARLTAPEPARSRDIFE